MSKVDDLDFRRWTVDRFRRDDKIRGMAPPLSYIYRQSYEDAIRDYKSDKKKGLWPRKEA